MYCVCVSVCLCVCVCVSAHVYEYVCVSVCLCASPQFLKPRRHMCGQSGLACRCCPRGFPS